MAYQLRDQQGRRVGQRFGRYQDAFNYRVQINGVGLVVIEVGEK